MTLKKLWLPALLLAATVNVDADTLYLRNGQSLNGTYLGGTSREIRFSANAGAAQTYAISRVRNLVIGDDQASTTRANSGYEATRSRTTGPSVPEGTTVTVRLIDPVDSDATSVGTTYRASLDEAIVVDGRTIAPQGADAQVQVVNVDQSGRLAGKEEIALVLSEIRANGQTYVPRTEHAQVAAKSRGNETAKVVGGTAIVGAIIGAIAGGGKGAAIGAATGAGAGVAIQAIRGQRIQIPSETRLDFRLTEPMPY
jgi:hypothetical protein